jgi:glycosyltransferase involved in cell wall biosynthesis
MTAPASMDVEPGGSMQAIPAVSVVVPCFNGGRFLDGLTASLAQQTFRDFEVVIVDDGSNDDLTLRKLATLESQARVIRQENRGLPAARNAGIREARADIVFPLDCDDTIEPTFLAETVAALRAAPPEVGMVLAHVRLVGAESGVVVPRYFNRFDLLFTNAPSNALVFRKECWRAAGGYDETMRDGYEDWDFSLRLAEAGFRGIEIAKPLYNYRVGSEQLPSMTSGIRANRLHAKLWRELRNRHPQSYGPLTMLRLWWATRDGSGRVPLWKGLAGYLIALTLPDAVFNRLVVRAQRRRLPPPPVSLAREPAQ